MPKVYRGVVSFIISHDETSSHSDVIRQFIDGLVETRFDKRKVIEKEIVTLVSSGIYKWDKGD